MHCIILFTSNCVVHFTNILFFQIFSSAGYHVALYDTVASQLTTALTSIESQLCDMESKGLMRSDGMTAQKAFQLVASFDDLQKALDGALYVQVCRCMLIAVIYKGSHDRSRKGPSPLHFYYSE